MSEEINYAPLIDQRPPEGLARWAMEQGELSKEYLIYKADWDYNPESGKRTAAVEVRCTACERSFLAEKVPGPECHNCYAPAPFGFVAPDTGMPVIGRDHALCPFCGAECELVHVGQIRYGIEDYAYAAVISRVKVPGRKDRLVLVDHQICRHIDKEGHSRFTTHPWTAWVVEERKVVRMMGYYKFFTTLVYKPLEQRKTFLDDFVKAELVWPFGEDALVGTTAENCKLDRYVEQSGKRLVAYLALWRKRPSIENLVMQGYGKLVDELIGKENDVCSYDRRRGIPKLPDINWKDKRPNRMLNLSKEEFRGWGHDLSAEDWKTLLWVRQEGLELNLPADMGAVKRLGKDGCMRLLELTGKDGFARGARYLMKQKKDTFILRDYWRNAGTAGWDLNDPAVKWPKRLEAAHDRAFEAARTRVEQENKKLFKERYKALSKYTAEFDGILIRPCRSQSELTKEGQRLHHCVAGYANDVATGKTAIFFIRRAKKPNIPWYTLELNEEELTVRQNRGKRNCDRTAEVQAFEDKWLEWLRSGAKKDKDGNAILPKEKGRNIA